MNFIFKILEFFAWWDPFLKEMAAYVCAPTVPPQYYNESPNAGDWFNAGVFHGTLYVTVNCFGVVIIFCLLYLVYIWLKERLNWFRWSDEDSARIIGPSDDEIAGIVQRIRIAGRLYSSFVVRNPDDELMWACPI